MPRLKSDDNGRSNKVFVKLSKHKDMVPVMNKKSPWKILTQMLQVSLQALHYLSILVFAFTTTICGLNLKYYGLVK